MVQKLDLIFLAVFLAGCRFPGPSDQNPLKNPGFENARKGTPQNWAVNSWQAGKEKAVVIADEAAYRSGLRSLKISHFLPNDTTVSQTAIVDPETTYRISGWVKTDKLKNIQGGIGATLSINGTWIMSSDLKGDNSWTYRELWIKTGKNQRQLTLSCRLGYWYNVAVGTAWFDDIKLERFDKVPEGIAVHQISGSMSGSGSAQGGLFSKLLFHLALISVFWLGIWRFFKAEWSSIEYGLVFIGAFIIYFLSAGNLALKQSLFTHYVYLADALLHGQLHLSFTPPHLHDYALLQGKIFVLHPILPGLLMTPFVALYGLGFNDVIFTVYFGALNVLLIYLIAAKLYPTPNLEQRLWPVLLFALGTCHWYLSVMGRVWHTASICALTFLLLGIHEMFAHKRLWLAGVWLGLSFLGRPPMIFGFAFFFIMFLTMNPGRRQGEESILKAAISFCLPIFVTIGIWMLYNHMRFANPFESGYSYLNKESIDLYQKYGLFHVRYLFKNIYYAFLSFMPVGTTFPYIRPDPWGNGLFFATPAFLFIFCAFNKAPLTLACWAGLLPILLSLMLYSWTGWTQFGYRYSIDFLPFLILLTSIGMGSRPPIFAKGLLFLSVIINFLGMRWFISTY